MLKKKNKKEIAMILKLIISFICKVCLGHKTESPIPAM